MHFCWGIPPCLILFTLGLALSLEEVRYSLHVTTMTLWSGDSFWSDDVWLVVLLSSMFALEMLTLGHSPLIGDRFCEMTVYARHILFRDYLVLRVYPFWEDAFILGHSHLADFDIETPPLVYDCCFWWIIELLTPWVQFSQHTWFDLDTHFPLLHTHTSYIWHHYTYMHPSYHSFTYFKPTYFIILHDLIQFSWSRGEDGD